MIFTKRKTIQFYNKKTDTSGPKNYQILDTLGELLNSGTEDNPGVEREFWHPSEKEKKQMLQGEEKEKRIIQKYRDAHPGCGNPRKLLIHTSVDAGALAEGMAICAKIDARKKALKIKDYLKTTDKGVDNIDN